MAMNERQRFAEYVVVRITGKGNERSCRSAQGCNF